MSEKLRSFLGARKVGVRVQLLGSLVVILALLLAVTVLNLVFASRLDRALAMAEEETARVDAALVMRAAIAEMSSALGEGISSRDGTYFDQVVGQADQTLSDAEESLVERVGSLPSGDSIGDAVQQLQDGAERVRGQAAELSALVEEGDWEAVDRYWESASVQVASGHSQMVRSLEQIEQWAAQRRESAAASAADARRMMRVIPVLVELLIVFVAMVTTFVTVRSITRPMSRLMDAATRLAAGHLDERVRLERQDEFGQLAAAFDHMAGRLQASYTELEQRVAERTRALQEANYALQRRAIQLETGAEVGRIIISIFDVDELLRRAVDLIRDRFGFYHAGIFLLDETGEWAVLREATGEAGAKMKEQGHRLPVAETSMVGWTALHREPRIALDVGKEAVRFAHPLLPYTRSEMTLPLVVGERLLGVLNVQSIEEAAFDEDDVRALQSMANQLAVAIENARRVTREGAILEATSPIYRTSHLLTRATTVDEVAETTIAAVAGTGADGCLVVVFEFSPDGEPEALSYAGVWRRDREPQFTPGMRLPIAESPFPLEMVSSMWTVPDVGKDESLPLSARRVFEETGVAAVANIPLRTEERVIGQVVVLRTEAGPFPESALRLYEALSAQAAVALERARLLEATGRRVEEEASLRTIGDRIARAVDMEAVLHSAAEGLSQVLRTGGIYVELGSGSDEGEKQEMEVESE